MCRLEYCGQKNKKYSFEYFLFIRARDGTRTRDPDLGKVVLYQLSHYRVCFVFPSEQYILYYRSSYLSTTFLKKLIFLKFLIVCSNRTVYTNPCLYITIFKKRIILIDFFAMMC